MSREVHVRIRERVGVRFPRATRLILFTPEQRTADKALRFVADRLGDLGLELHPEKTRVIETGPGFSFLGRPLPRPPKPAASKTQDR